MKRRAVGLFRTDSRELSTAGILLLAYAVGHVEGAEASFFSRLNFDNIFNAVPHLAVQNPELLTSIGFLLMIGAIGQ